MRIIWRRGEVTVLDVRAELEEGGKAVALPTIRTMLGILQEKGHVTRRASGRQHIYSPTGSESEGEGPASSKMWSSVCSTVPRAVWWLRWCDLTWSPGRN